MCPPMIRGLFTGVPSWRGRDGIRIPESGMKARTSRSELASASVSSEAMDGAGVIGGSIVITTTPFTTTTDTILGAVCFISVTITTVVAAIVAGATEAATIATEA